MQITCDSPGTEMQVRADITVAIFAPQPILCGHSTYFDAVKS